MYDAGGSPEALARRLADHAAAEPDDMQRRIAPLLVHLEPLMRQVVDNVERQFPPPPR